jgi:hypothetical protein
MTNLNQQLDQVANRLAKVDQVETEWIEGTAHLLVNKSTVVKDYFGVLLKKQEESHKGWQEFEKDLDELSQAFAELAQISGGALSGILSQIGKMVGSANLGVKAIEGIDKAMDAIHDAKGIKDTSLGIVSLTANILSAVAAAISFGKALADIFHRSRAEQLQSSVLKDFGVGITEDIGQQIENRAKTQFGGSRQAAQVGSLADIISAGGGVTTANLDKLQARLRDVFSLLQTGELTGAQSQKILNDNFSTFVDFLGGRVNPALKEIIKLNDQFGTHSKAIADYVDAQANKALSSLTKVISARGDLVSQLEAAQKKGDKGAIAKLQAQLAALPLTAGGGQALGASLFGIFERLTKDGASALDVLSQLDPVIESLDKQLAKAGLSGGAAFDQIKSLAGIATDEIAGPAFQAIQAYGQALEGLNNSAVLTQEEFSGLTEQITATYTAAVDALVKQGKDGSKALHLIAPQLQEIWELQQDFGYAVDDSTQKLLDQAVAAGDVGEKHRSIQEQTLDVLQHVSDVLDLIGEKFGVDIPRDVDKTVKAFDKVGMKIDDAIAKIPDNVHIGVKFDIPELPDNYTPLSHGGAVPFSKGGPVYAAGGYFASKGTDTIPAMLSPGEFVISRRGVQAAGMPALRSINNGVPPMGGGNVTTVNVYVNNKLDHAESQKIAAAIAPHIPGVVANGGSTHGKWSRMTKVLAK